MSRCRTRRGVIAVFGFSAEICAELFFKYGVSLGVCLCSTGGGWRRSGWLWLVVVEVAGIVHVFFCAQVDREVFSWVLMVLKLDPPYEAVSYITGKDIAASTFWGTVDNLFGKLASFVNGEFWWEDRLTQTSTYRLHEGGDQAGDTPYPYS